MAKAADGDTVKVRTHDKVLIQTDPSKGSTNYTAWGQFPAKGTKSYHKMYAELTFQCPPGLTCGEWDYLNYIFIGKRHGATKDTLNWEIMRFITPYGLQFSNQWKHTWRFDITDFATLFHDSVEIWYQHTGYEAKNGRGWLITVDFTMIEGVPVKPVNNIQLLYRTSAPYGNDSLFDAKTPKTAYTVGDKTQEIRYKVLQSGHGADQPESCGEFCAKYRSLIHDGNPVDTVLVWRDNCGENPVYPQGGTWIYDRANWCPGAEVEEYNKDISVLPTSKHDFDLRMESYNHSSGSANYMLTAYVVEYGAPSFHLDAAINDVVKPSSELRHLRYNPSCGEPQIVVVNNGTTTIHSLLIEYGWDHFLPKRFLWNGNLEFGREAAIDLPWLENQGADSVLFFANIIWVNNQNDDYSKNNLIHSSAGAKAPTLPSDLVIILRTNKAASENYYTLKSADGKIYANGNNFANNTLYRDTVHLPPGCYLLNLMDDGPAPAAYNLNKDGLGWWANTYDGTGMFQLRNAGNNAIVNTFGVDFGTGIWYQFMVGETAQPAAAEAKLTFYPNPVQHDLLVDLGKNTVGNLQFQLFNATGQKIVDITRSGNLDALQYFNLEKYTTGIYFIKIQLGDKVLSSRLMIY